MPGYINLPKWKDYLLSKLIGLNMRDMVSYPVLGEENAEAPWQTLDFEDFFSAVDVGISFYDDLNSKNFAGNLITIDSETSIDRLNNEKYANTFFCGAIGGIAPFLQILNNPYQISKPVKIFVQNDGIVSYILSAIEKKGKTLEEAIHESQWEKITDSNPIKNIHGIVTCNRFILLLSEIFGILISQNDFSVSGINNLDLEDVNIARNMGFSIRLLGIAEKTDNETYKIAVEPCLIPSAFMLAQARGGSEIIYVKTDDGMTQVYGCPGTSVDTCINGILYDLFNQARTHKNNATLNNKINLKEFEDSFYIRIETTDKTSSLSSILNCFNNHGIKILSIHEPTKKYRIDNEPETIILITSPVSKSVVYDCIYKEAVNIPDTYFKSYYRFINR